MARLKGCTYHIMVDEAVLNKAGRDCYQELFPSIMDAGDAYMFKHSKKSALRAAHRAADTYNLPYVFYTSKARRKANPYVTRFTTVEPRV